MDSKVVLSLGMLTDDKSAFRQWDLKLINALNFVRPGYGKALDKLKESIDRGEDLEDARPGAASDSPIHFGTALVARLKSLQGEGRRCGCGEGRGNTGRTPSPSCGTSACCGSTLT